MIGMRGIVSVILALILSFAVAEPATPTDIANDMPVSVSVEIDTPIEQIAYGKPLTMSCVVHGLDGPYTVQWQFSPDKTVWFDLQCTDDVYRFVLNEQNAGYYYRVIIHSTKDF